MLGFLDEGETVSKYYFRWMQDSDIRAMIQGGGGGGNRRSLKERSSFDDGSFHAIFVVDQVAVGQLNTSISPCQNYSTYAPNSYASYYYF
jgi:hypothetical protein